MTTIVPELKPSVLVSFEYRKEWAAASHLDYWREVVLDSGAFTAAKKGTKIDIVELAEWIKSERARSPLVTEAFTLDVIGGSWRESLANTETLWKMGIDVIPVYHVGEPTDVLKALARDYPKVGLGGAVGYRKKLEWATLCFREVWPAKLHGLGFGKRAIEILPFHSVDDSSWSFGPTAFAVYPSTDYKKLPTRNVRTLNLRHEVVHQMDAEARARRFWAGRIPDDFGLAPQVRLATNARKQELRFLSPNFIPLDVDIKDFPRAGDLRA